MIKSPLRRVPLLVLTLGLLLTACTTSTTPADSAAAAKTATGPKPDRNAPPPGAGKGRWVRVESSLGSNLPRRVWVNEDGSVIPDPGDRVQAVSGDAVKRAATQQSLKGGN